MSQPAFQGPPPSGPGAPPPPPPQRPPLRHAPGILRVVALAVAFVGAAALLVAFALRGRPAAPSTPLTALPPLEAEHDQRTGEDVAPFSGFAVSVETVPPGALVLVDGVARGEAPVLAGLDCPPGREIEIRAEAAGRRAATRVACRADALVKVTLRLER